MTDRPHSEDAGTRVPGTDPKYFFVFDVESVGLHGDAFAYGFVVIDREGTEHDYNIAWCDPAEVQGAPSDREWVAKNVPEFHEQEYESGPRALRDLFWRVWRRWADLGAWMAADCAWPVEARFLHACAADDPDARNWNGPYPLIDIGSVRLGVGLNPLGSEERRSDELPLHHPLADARQSARLLLEALRAAPSTGAPDHETPT